MKNEIIVAGHLSKSEWGGQLQPREQDWVIDAEGISMAIPSSYSRHPFKVLVNEADRDIRTIEEQGQARESGQTQSE